jgi:hypothetical protein
MGACSRRPPGDVREAAAKGLMIGGAHPARLLKPKCPARRRRSRRTPKTRAGRPRHEPSARNKANLPGAGIRQQGSGSRGPGSRGVVRNKANLRRRCRTERGYRRRLPRRIRRRTCLRERRHGTRHDVRSPDGGRGGVAERGRHRRITRNGCKVRKNGASWAVAGCAMEEDGQSCGAAGVAVCGSRIGGAFGSKMCRMADV